MIIFILIYLKGYGIIMKRFGNTAFARFFTKFHKLFLANLLFMIPFAASIGIFVLIGYLTGFNNVIIWGLSIIPVFPLYAGLTMVIRKYAIEKIDCNVISVFFNAVKENWKQFLIHGVITYAILACSIFAFVYYGSMANVSLVYASLFSIYALFAVGLLVMMFYVPLMTVTYALRVKDIYKNALLLIFGKIVRNIGALALVALITVPTVIALGLAKGPLLIVTVVAIALFYTLFITYIIISVISKGLQEAVGSFVEPVKRYIPTEEDIKKEETAVSNANSSDDYIFVNGRMIKNTTKNNKN